MKSSGSQRDAEATLSDNEARRKEEIHGSKSVSNFCLLCTDRSLRPARGTFLHLHHPSMQVRAAHYPWSRLTATSTAHSSASSVSATPTRRDLSRQTWRPRPPTLRPTLPSKVFRQWRRSVGSILYHAGFTEACHDISTHPACADMAVSLDVQRIRNNPEGSPCPCLDWDTEV
ncbi:hypothetical protein GWK47_040247 [Chionoecetes opilio]|uniref:Uncharacterized protein n=1 Tax=Chionoecetes opilio TaxID=41210 RepID=A0A8J4YIR1_CHIOP|nr:hypothetical protein GWK47_040247 [Chionoecetes opilio]